MDALIAPVYDRRFDMETTLEMQLGAKPLPFPGMDKSGAAICVFHLKAVCEFGQMCPFRHIHADRKVVCKHWLRGLCKKGDDCEFLHEYDMSKMPECYFFQRYGQCGNKECPFLHIDPESKRIDCPWYDRGFCRHGPMCKNRHNRKVMCQSYLAGFCLHGPRCKHAHPKWELPTTGTIPMSVRRTPKCHFCGEMGHVVYKCFKASEEEKAKFQEEYNQKNAARAQRMYSHQEQQQDPPPSDHRETFTKKDYDKITCYKCGLQGHFANRCPKGDLAFLSVRPKPETPSETVSETTSAPKTE